MKARYIIQLKRKYLWEDIVSYTDKIQAFVSTERLRKDNPNLQIRLVEVFVLC